MAAKQKLTVYIPDEMLDELKQEAARQDRSVSWLIEHCWHISRRQLRRYPGVKEMLNGEMSP